MQKLKVVEKFISINGEGKRAGQLAVFIRFWGCNLHCGYCDTKWANETDAPFTYMSPIDIYDYLKETGIKNCTLTGGEPLLQEGIGELLGLLSKDDSISIEIETNGSVDVSLYAEISDNILFTMDYKLPSSGMENEMCVSNFSLLKEKDTVKFVAGSREDLQKAKEIIEKYRLAGRLGIYLSPVFGSIEPFRIVEFMAENKMNDINMQLQLHKFIWDPDKRGV